MPEKTKPGLQLKTGQNQLKPLKTTKPAALSAVSPVDKKICSAFKTALKLIIKKFTCFFI